MLSTQLLCLYKQPTPPPLFDSLGILFKNRNRRRLIIRKTPCSSSSYYYYYSHNNNNNWCIIVHAVKEDSQSQQYEYEVDPDKAREALQKLDQQLQSLSNKQIPSPKIKVSDVKLTKEQANDTDEKLEISDSFLASLAAGLVLFTIFYNVLFYTVIKPSIDGS